MVWSARIHDCWDIPGFGVMCDLLDDPPEPPAPEMEMDA